MTASKNLADILIEEIVELHTVERQFLQALPRMAQVAHDPELKAALQQQMVQSQAEIGRLDRVMDMLGITDECAGAQAVSLLIGEDDIWLNSLHSDNAMDARIICTAMKVEHFKMGCYLSLCTFASLLGLDEVCSELENAFPRPVFFRNSPDLPWGFSSNRLTPPPKPEAEISLVSAGIVESVN